MPKKLINDYIFYKIVCLNDDIILCYVGSTANWKERQRTHKGDCNNENSKKYNYKIYKTIREYGGWSNFKMIQIGTREQLNKREAEQIEEEYRVELKANMNTKRCYITEEQKKEKEKQHNKKYYEDNKETLIEQKKIYRENNKEKIAKKEKEYKENNKEKIAEHRKEKRKEKVTCDCGCIIRKDDLTRHKITNKHLELMNDLE